MCVQVRREYVAEHLKADRAARFSGAALMNVLPPTAWQVADDVELVVGQYAQTLSEHQWRGTAFVEVTVHSSYIEVVVGTDDPDWVDQHVRLRPRRPFTATFECRSPDPRPAPQRRPVLWPALGRPRIEPSLAAWGQIWNALHEISQSLRQGPDAVVHTLDAVAGGVVKATAFTVAVVNVVQPDGDFRVAAIEGSPGARQALLGVVEPGERWMTLISRGLGWGSLCYVPRALSLPVDRAFRTWSDTRQQPDDPDLWNPLDALIAPLYSADHVCLGTLSVDLPTGAARPSIADLECLEVFADHAAAAIERVTVRPVGAQHL